MKKTIFFLTFCILTLISCGQTTFKTNVVIQKTTPTLYLTGSGATISFNSGNVTLIQGNHLLTMSGGDFALAGGYSLLMTGSIGSSANRILKGWFTDLEITNSPTVNGVPISSIYAPINNPSFTTAISTPVLIIGATTLTSTAAELNVLHNSSVTATEMGYLHGVTSSVQGQVNAKQATLVSGTNIKTVGGTSLLGSGDISVGGTGSVTSVAVTTANGVSASITNPTSTPNMTFTLGAITPSSVAASGTVTGSNLSGTNTGDNATNSQYSGLISNATHTGDATGSTALTVKGINGTLLSGLSTGLLKNTTVTGVPSIASAGTDYVVPSGSITGNAATATKLATARTINGVSFDGTANITVASNITPSTSGNVMTSNGATWTSSDPKPAIYRALQGKSDSAIVAIARSDSNIVSVGGYATVNYVNSVIGTGGSGSNIKYLDVYIGQTGFPSAGDSTLTHSSFPGKYIVVWRGPDFMYQHTDNTTSDGFRFDNITGTLTFRPPFAAGEELMIWATNTIQFQALVPEGGGGAGASSLLTGLVASYSFNETGGSTITDNLGSHNATASGVTLGSAGKFGNCATMSSSVAYMDDGSTGLELTNLTISVWIKTSTIPSGDMVIVSKVANSPSRGYFMAMTSSGIIKCVLYNSTYGSAVLYSSTALNDGLWHNLIMTDDGADLRFYLGNGTTTTEDANSPTVFAHYADYATGATQFKIATTDHTNAFIGSIDELNIFSRVVTSGERTLLQTKFYPFN